MRIKWTNDIGVGSKLRLDSEWEVSSVLIHTIRVKIENVWKEQMLLVIRADEKQIHKLQDDYGKWNIPISLLGLEPIALEPNAVLWTWNPPKGYETSCPTQKYTAFEVLP